MATFEIQGPDGKTYEIEAPDMDSAVSALQSVSGGAGGSSVDQGSLDTFKQGARDVGRSIGNAAISARSGATFGGIDEINGVLRGAVLGQMPGEGSFNYDVPMTERYAANRDVDRQLQGDVRAESPVASTVGEIGGALLPSVVGGTIAAGTKQGLPLVGRLTGYGALEGAAYGAGNSDGGDLRADMLQGAVVGGAAGAAAKPIADLTQRGARAVAAPFAGVVDAITGRASQPRANNVVARTMERAGMSADDVARQAQRAAAQGQPEFVMADILGQPGQNALSGVARTPGQGAAEIYDFLQSRQGQQGRRMTRFVSEALDAPDTATARRTSLEASRARRGDIAYDQAREASGPVNLNAALETIDTTLRRDPILGDTALSQGEIGRRLASLRDQLEVDGEQLIDFNKVLDIKIDLGRQIQRNPDTARDLLPALNALDAALEKSSGRYRSANDAYSRASNAIDAIDTGTAWRGTKARSEDSIPSFNAMTPPEQASARVGYSEPIAAKIQNTPSGTNAARTLTDDGTLDEINAISRNPNLFNERVARENTMFETRNRALGGSMTANNEANIDDVKPFDVGMIANLLQGRFGAAAQQATQTGTNALTGRNEATQQLIAQMLMSRDPQRALAPVVAQMRKDGVSNQVIQSVARQLSQRAGNAALQ